MIIGWILLGILAIFIVVVLRGAPYVPTHRATIEAALDMLPLKSGSKVVDLGSGDGAFLKAAAQRGLQTVGYEINPILCPIAWLRCLSVRSLVSVRWRDFWVSALPPKTDAVFIFLAGPFMKRLSKYLNKTMLKRNKPLFVISNGFAIPGFTPEKHEAGLYLYKLLPMKR